jgi:hypothetical protein
MGDVWAQNLWTRGGGWGAHTYTPRYGAWGARTRCLQNGGRGSIDIMPSKTPPPPSLKGDQPKREAARPKRGCRPPSSRRTNSDVPKRPSSLQHVVADVLELRVRSEFRHLSRPLLKSVRTARARAAGLRLYGKLLTLLMDFVLSGKGVSEVEQGRASAEI